MTSTFLRNRAGWAALAMVVWALLMLFVERRDPFPHNFHRGITSAVLALELSRNLSDSDTVLHPKGIKGDAEKAARDNMTVVNELDLVFIPLYCFSLWSLGRVFSDRTRILTIGIVATGLFDYIEDWQISRVIGGSAQQVYIPSLVKWALLGLSLMVLGGILARSVTDVYTMWTRRLMGIAFFVAGGLILIDVAFGDWIAYSHIAFGNLIFGLTSSVNVFGLLRHSVTSRSEIPLH